jgi:hypothetical protein
MRIPHNILNCVCFLGVHLTEGKDAGKFLPLGTGYFVMISEGEQDWRFLYLVTAKHALDEAIRAKLPLEARLNKRQGGSEYIPLEAEDKWWRSAEADLALIPMVVDAGIFEYEALPLRMLATDEKLSQHAIGLGDDLFSVGLFALRTGKQRNIPIVRTGIISALPSEKLTEKGKPPYHAYLSEMRSIAGLSGSPVFVYIDRFRSVDSNIPEGHDWTFFCIGYVRAHWKLDRDIISDDFVSSDVALGFNPGETLNVGIAVVMPSQYVVNMLMHPSLQKMRKEHVEMREQENEPVNDSVRIPKKGESDEPLTRSASAAGAAKK